MLSFNFCLSQSILEKKVKLKKQEGSIEFLLLEIAKKGSFVFSYGHDISIRDVKQLTSSHQTVNQYLYEIFGNSIYTVEYGHKLIIIKKPALPEYYHIKGRVIDSETKQPIPGVAVYIPKSDPLIGGVSNSEGYFDLKTKVDVSTINLSCIGYQVDSLPWTKGGEALIELDPLKHELSEVEIVYYMMPKPEELNYAGSVIDNEIIEHANTGGVERTLQGTAPGVRVVANSGMPGASLQVKVRGVNSAINSDPIYLLDGIPMQQSLLYTISPADIDEITIVKDAAELTKYGSIAGNGVVLLQSKLEINKPTKVSYRFSFGQQQVYRKLDLMTTEEFLDFSKLVGREGAVPDSLIGLYNTDWQNLIFQKGNKTEHFIELCGSNQKNAYRLSTGVFNQKAIVKRLEFKRYSFKISSGHQVNSRINIGQNTLLAHLSYKGINEGTFLNDYGNVLLGAILKVPFPDTNQTSPLMVSPNAYVINPYDDAELIHNVKQNYGVANNTKLKVKILPEVWYSTNFGVNALFQDAYNTKRTIMHIAPGVPEQYYFTEYSVFDLAFYWQQNLVFVKNIFSHHNFKVDLQTEFGKNRNLWIPVNRTRHFGAMGDDADSIASESNVYLKEGATTRYENKAYSCFVDYSFKNKYFASVNLRNDRVGFVNQKKKQVEIEKYYPSIALGYIITNEDFVPELFLNYAKLRISYGKTGISPVLNYSFYAKVFRDFEYLYAFESSGNSTASARKRRVNESFFYEDMDAHNVGVDLGFLRNKLFFSVDFFRNHTYLGSKYDFKNVKNFYKYLNNFALMANIPLESAEMVNKGFEYELSFKQKMQKLTIDVHFNLSHLSNKIINYQEKAHVLYNNNADHLSVNLRGKSLGSFYGYKTNGVFTSADVINGKQVSEVQPAAREGDLRFVDLNNDGVINVYDKTIIGDPFPEFTSGLFCKVKYLNLDFSFLVQGVYGNNVLNATKLWLYNPYGLSNWSRDMYNSYRQASEPDGGNTDTDLFRVDYYNTNKNLRVSDFYIEDGSYLRVKNIQLGYSFNKLANKTGFYNELRLYIAVQNLYTFTNYSGYDPEVGGWGVDCGAYPNPKVYMCGLNVDF